MSDLSDDLESIFKNIIFLTYRSECQFKHFGGCYGKKTILRLIPFKDIKFRWNPNNAVVVCNHHLKQWETDPNVRLELYQSLSKQLEGLSEYLYPSKPVSGHLGAVKEFLVGNANLIISQKIAPFPFLENRDIIK